jgi:hypothetical protein
MTGSSSAKTKDLDDLTFGTTQPERQSHLAALILKHSNRIKDIREACDVYYEIVDSFMGKNGGRGIPAVYKKYRNQILKGLDNIQLECKVMLRLTGQKCVTEYANSVLTKFQNGEKKLEDAAVIASGKILEDESAIANLEKMNKKLEMKKKLEGKRVVSPVESKQRSKRMRNGVVKLKSNVKNRSIKEGNTHTTFYAGSKSWKIPNPTECKEHLNMYSMSETVKHLDKYDGTGSLRLFEVMRNHKRVAFGRSTYQKMVKTYKKT